MSSTIWIIQGLLILVTYGFVDASDMLISLPDILLIGEDFYRFALLLNTAITVIIAYIVCIETKLNLFKAARNQMTA